MYHQICRKEERIYHHAHHTYVTMHTLHPSQSPRDAVQPPPDLHTPHTSTEPTLPPPAPDVPPAILTIDGMDVSAHVSTTISTPSSSHSRRATPSHGHTRHGRTLRFVSPSRKQRRTRLLQGTALEQTVQEMTKEALMQLLVEHQLVHPGSVAPVNVLRDIARGVFQQD